MSDFNNPFSYLNSAGTSARQFRSVESHRVEDEIKGPRGHHSSDSGSWWEDREGRRKELRRHRSNA